MKKKIAAFLLATFVAFSSFAQSSWTPIGIGNYSSLAMRNLSKDNGSGEYTAEFRLEYTVTVKSPDGDDVSRSIMKLSMNCFSRESKILSDVHISTKGEVLTKFTNAWTKSGDHAPSATSAGKIVLDKICKTI